MPAGKTAGLSSSLFYTGLRNALKNSGGQGAEPPEIYPKKFLPKFRFSHNQNSRGIYAERKFSVLRLCEMDSCVTWLFYGTYAETKQA